MLKGYYFITDDELSLKGNFSDVKQAVEAGIRIIQYRSKNKSTFQMCKEAAELKNSAAKALFIVNDRVDIALAIDAHGVHLGQEDMSYDQARKILGKDKIIGVSVRNIEQAVQAQKQGADYIGVGPVFSTQTKSDAGRPLGLDLLKAIRGCVSLPIAAIGGITLKNAFQVIEAGADSICAISAVVKHDNVKEEVFKFQRLFT